MNIAISYNLIKRHFKALLTFEFVGNLAKFNRFRNRNNLSNLDLGSSDIKGLRKLFKELSLLIPSPVVDIFGKIVIN